MTVEEELEPVVELEGVGRTYARGEHGVAALVAIGLTLRAGEAVAVIGPSGCGKSTLLHVVSAVDRADVGRVRVCGEDLRRASESELTLLRRRRIGVVFQDYQLVPNLSARDNVALPLALDGKSDPARVEALLERVGLSERGSHMPSELSGGEQQRIAVARALVHRPALVVADEPTGNLDSTNGREVLDLLFELREREGSALLLATHDLDVAARADRVLRLSDGRIVGSDREAAR